MRTLAKHVTGAIVAVIVAAALYGGELEELLFPVIGKSEMSDLRVSDGRISWTLNVCKLRDVEVNEIRYFYTIVSPSNPLAGSQTRLLDVRNDNLGTPAGGLKLPPDCYVFRQSGRSPIRVESGDTISGEAVYPGWRELWETHFPLGVAVIP